MFWKTVLTAAVLATTLGLVAHSNSEACPGGKVAAGEGKEKVHSLSVAEVDGLVKQAAAWIGDVNSDSVRKSQGIIPGAKLYSGKTDLPDSKSQKLVFYCYNEMCGASHAAAEKAVAAGYSDVNVLPAGIMGWKKAGKKVAQVN